MATKIRCPACRKGVVAGEADAGKQVLCLACGRSFQAPVDLAGTPGDSNGPAAAARAGGDGEPEIDLSTLDNDNVKSTAGPNGQTTVVAAVTDTSVSGRPFTFDVQPEVEPSSAPSSSTSPLAPEFSFEARTSSTIPPPAVGGARGGRFGWLGWVVAAGLALAWLLQSMMRHEALEQPDAMRFPAAPSKPQPPSPPSDDTDRTAPSETGSTAAEQTDDGNPSESARMPGMARAPNVDPSVTRPGAGPEWPDVGGSYVGPSLATTQDSGPAQEPSAPAEQPEQPQPSDDAGPPPGVALAPPPPADGTTGPSAPTTAQSEWRPVVRRRGPLRPIPPPPGVVTDEQIESAIRRGVEYLNGMFGLPGVDAPGNSGGQFLMAYALIQGGMAVRDPRFDPRGEHVDAMLERVKRLPIAPDQATYQRSVRATLLAMLNRPQDRDVLQDDVKRLVAGHVKGGYTYALATEQRSQRGQGGGIGGSGFYSTDNSNSQYGLLGVWSGAEAAVEVPSHYWEAVNRYWVDAQLGDGAWSYTPDGGNIVSGGNGYVAMAAAGTASLFVTHDQLSRGNGNELGRDPFPPALALALRWWETKDDWLKPVDPNSPFGGRFWGYQLYGIERVGLASGFKYFGKHDWYRTLAGQAVQMQSPNGSWRDGETAETAFVLLFLARGRPPILMNKLRFDGSWANRPRDLSNLARFASHATERPLNWQIVDLRTEWHDWLDAPILYLASHEALKLEDTEVAKLRQYALAGGMLFTHADGARRAFDAFAEKLARQLFPRYELKDLPPDHPIYNIVAKVDPKPKLRAVSNGSRILMIHSPTDISRAWQGRDDKRKQNLFNLGLNLFVYATGKRDLRNRLDSPYVPAPVRPVGDGNDDSITVARIRYAGHWDPEPGAWERFGRLFNQRTGIQLKPVTVKWAELTPETAPVAHLTGTALYQPQPEEVEALRAYVEAGGVLLVDNCGGMGAFAGEMKSVLGDAFPQSVLDPVRRNHPVLSAGEPGMADVAKPKYRPFAVARQGGRPGLYGFRAGGGQVLLTTLDITSGLLHTGTWGMYGYDPDYCESLVQNLVLWAHDTQPQ